MRFIRRLSLALIASAVLWPPLVASAAWRFEENGPYRVDKDREVAITPKDTRSLAPKAGVAMPWPVAPRVAEPPVGTRSLAPKAWVAMPWQVPAPGAVEPSRERQITSD